MHLRLILSVNLKQELSTKAAALLQRNNVLSGDYLIFQPISCSVDGLATKQATAPQVFMLLIVVGGDRRNWKMWAGCLFEPRTTPAPCVRTHSQSAQC